MDLKHFYSEVALVEEQIEGKDTLTVSLATGDGGKPGVISEVPKRMAAELVVGKKARLATPDEVDYYRLEQAEAHKRKHEESLAQRVQVTLVSENEWKAARPKKG